MTKAKNWKVNINGCEPFYADHDEACAWLWCSRVEGERAEIYCAADPGARHAKDLDLANFPDKSSPVYSRIMELFEDAETEDCAALLRDLFTGFPGDVLVDPEAEGKPAIWKCDAGEQVELRVKSDFVLRRKLHHYLVVFTVPGDADVCYDGVIKREALKAFCAMASKSYFGDRIRTELANG